MGRYGRAMWCDVKQRALILKLEALHGGLLLREKELLVGLVHLRGKAAVLVFHPEVVLNQVEGLLVDLLVVVALEELDLVKAWEIKRNV